MKQLFRSGPRMHSPASVMQRRAHEVPVVRRHGRLVRRIIDQPLGRGDTVHEVTQPRYGTGHPHFLVEADEPVGVLARTEGRGWDRSAVRPERDGEPALVEDLRFDPRIQGSDRCSRSCESFCDGDFQFGSGASGLHSHSGDHVTWLKMDDEAVRVLENDRALDGQPVAGSKLLARRECCGSDRPIHERDGRRGLPKASSATAGPFRRSNSPPPDLAETTSERHLELDVVVVVWTWAQPYCWR